MFTVGTEKWSPWQRFRVQRRGYHALLIAICTCCSDQWSKVARSLPGRSVNAVKNHWYAVSRGRGVLINGTTQHPGTCNRNSSGGSSSSGALATDEESSCNAWASMEGTSPEHDGLTADLPQGTSTVVSAHQSDDAAEEVGTERTGVAPDLDAAAAEKSGRSAIDALQGVAAAHAGEHALSGAERRQEESDTSSTAHHGQHTVQQEQRVCHRHATGHGHAPRSADSKDDMMRVHSQTSETDSMLGATSDLVRIAPSRRFCASVVSLHNATEKVTFAASRTTLD